MKLNLNNIKYSPRIEEFYYGDCYIMTSRTIPDSFSPIEELASRLYSILIYDENQKTANSPI